VRFAAAAYIGAGATVLALMLALLTFSNVPDPARVRGTEVEFV